MLINRKFVSRFTYEEKFDPCPTARMNSTCNFIWYGSPFRRPRVWPDNLWYGYSENKKGNISTVCIQPPNSEAILRGELLMVFSIGTNFRPDKWERLDGHGALAFIKKTKTRKKKYDDRLKKI